MTDSERIDSFTDYCRRNPSQRFWQALRNWSGYSFIIASDHPPNEPGQIDTFHLGCGRKADENQSGIEQAVKSKQVTPAV